MSMKRSGMRIAPLDIELTGHLGFGMKGIGHIAFGVQRYQDALYITSVSKDIELKVGDKIIRVDGLDINDFAKKHELFLFGEIELITLFEIVMLA